MKRNPNHKHEPSDLSNKNKVIGLAMTLEETQAFFKSLGRKVVTFFGYSVDYENEESMLAIAKDALSEYSPETFLINIGATAGGIGAVYPLAKAMGFQT